LCARRVPSSLRRSASPHWMRRGGKPVKSPKSGEAYGWVMYCAISSEAK
jgi:hypothetical protein